MDLIHKIYRSSILILIPATIVSAFIEWWRLPAGVLAGGLLALINFRGLVRGVRGLLGAGKGMGRMIFLSQFRLIMLFLVLGLIVYLKLVNIFGILAGFTIVFAIVLIEGYRDARDTGRAGSFCP